MAGSVDGGLCKIYLVLRVISLKLRKLSVWIDFWRVCHLNLGIKFLFILLQLKLFIIKLNILLVAHRNGIPLESLFYLFSTPFRIDGRWLRVRHQNSKVGVIILLQMLMIHFSRKRLIVSHTILGIVFAFIHFLLLILGVLEMLFARNIHIGYLFEFHVLFALLLISLVAFARHRRNPAGISCRSWVLLLRTFDTGAPSSLILTVSTCDLVIAWNHELPVHCVSERRGYLLIVVQVSSCQVLIVSGCRRFSLSSSRTLRAAQTWLKLRFLCCHTSLRSYLLIFWIAQ